MTEKHFEDVEQYHLTAAQVGIHASRWTKVNTQKSLDEVREIMRQKQYDVVPIENTEGITHYYTTLERGNFSGAIEKREIQAEDKLYYLSQIEDVIALFQQQKRHFFFLWDYRQVVGLISEVNLKSTAVAVYLYAQSNALEMALSKLFLLAYSDENEFKAIVIKGAEAIANNDKRNKRLTHLQEVFDRYEAEKITNTHQHLIEHLTLRDLFDVLRKENWLQPFGYKNKTLKKISQRIKDVRNYIAHPVKKMIPTSDILSFLQQTRQLLDAIAQAELDVHYRKTHYRVSGHHQPIEIDKPLPKSLAELSESQSWCFITAFNPASRTIDSSINAVLNQQLKQDLEALGLQVFEGQGESTTDKDYPPELSFWVPGISRKEAEKLGQKYGQNAIVYGEPEGNAELVKIQLKQEPAHV